MPSSSGACGGGAQWLLYSPLVLQGAVAFELVQKILLYLYWIVFNPANDLLVFGFSQLEGSPIVVAQNDKFSGTFFFIFHYLIFILQQSREFLIANIRR